MKKLLSFVLVLTLVLPTIPVSADEPVTESVAEVTVTEPTPEVPGEVAISTEATSTPVVEVTEPEEVVTTPEPSFSEEIIVKLTDDSSGTITAVEDAGDVTVTEVLPDNVVLAQTEGLTAEAAAEILEDLPSVEYAEPNYDRAAFVIGTTDTYQDRLWGLDNSGQSVNGTTGTAGDDIDALHAWGISYGTSTVVAVIDSGVMYTHPDLSANMWSGTSCVDYIGQPLGNCVHGYDFADNDLDPIPVTASTSFAHGTHVAGTIAAARNNGVGVAGVAPSASIMALRFGFDVASEVRAIKFAQQNGVKIINASYGGDQFSQAERDAIQDFTNAGGIFVAAAGNYGDTSNIYPAAYDIPGIISVAATDQNDALASFSNYGATTVDIAAPGVDIASTYISSSSAPVYAYADGTSMAAPHVAGTAALIKSVYPLLSPAAIRDAIVSSGPVRKSVSGKTVSGRRLDAYRALLAATSSPLDTEAPTITLEGNSSVSLTVGSTYTELGASAFDAHDGTTTATIGGDVVNTSAAGTYHVTYDATDTSDNEATQVVRTVTVTAVSSGGGGGGGGGGSSHSSNKTKKKKSGASSKTTTKKTVANPPRPALASNTAPAAPSVATTPVAPTVPFTRLLSLGSTGADVTALQQALTRLGVYSGPITGYFGPVTQSGVSAYQTKHGLPPVGVVGPMTRALLNQGV